MSIIVRNIALSYTAGEGDAVEAALKKLGLAPSDTVGTRVRSKSLDARRRMSIRFVYSVEIELADGMSESRFSEMGSDVVIRERREAPDPEPGSVRLGGRPVIAGFGPAGMFAALTLARAGYRPLVIERGEPVEKRAVSVARHWRGEGLDPNSNVQFGEGGAGTFSDGKLVSRIGDPLCEAVIRTLARHGGGEDILVDAKPHIGTDRLKGIVRSLREEIISLGGEVIFGSKLTGVSLGEGIKEVFVNGERRDAGVLILAVGHSARDTFKMLFESGVKLEAKPFSVGVRIEQLQEDIDRALYGEYAGDPRLPKGEYQLSDRSAGRGVYTFCMCPGGVVVGASSEAGGVVTNGMSGSMRSGKNANCALVVSVDPADFGGGALGGIEFQRSLERAAYAAGGGEHVAPVQLAGLFEGGSPPTDFGRIRSTYLPGTRFFDLGSLFPTYVRSRLAEGLSIFERRIRGFAPPDAVLTGVESRTSSPVRMLRGEDFEAVGIPGLYPAGEGAGYAGGIVSSAVDGIRVAEAVIAKYARPIG